MEYGKFSRDRDERGGNDRDRNDSERRDQGGNRGGTDRNESDRRDQGGNRGGYNNDRPRFDRNDQSGGRGGYNNDRPRFDRDRRGGGGGDFGGRSRYERTDRGGFDRGGSDRGDRGGFDRRDEDESVFSKKVRAGKRRTYFLDVRKTRGEDFFITITESTRRDDGFGYKRHKIFLYKEDFNRFAASLNEVVEHVKTSLMPDFDYEEFDRRQAEWEAQNRAEDDDGEARIDAGNEDDFSDDEEDNREKRDGQRKEGKSDEDDDVTW